MVIEELIAKLGFRATGGKEASAFLKDLEKIKKATKELGKDFRINLGGRTSGLGKVTAEIERATRAWRSYRIEAERASRVRPGGGRYGPGGRIPGRRPVDDRVLEPGLAGAGLSPGRAGVIAGGAYTAGRIASAALRSSMSFERAMIEVTKATDANPAEREDYAKAITRLARDTGKKKEELAGMLAAAGFAGRPKDELMRFTAFGARASTAWGTTPEATGQAMAEIGNIYQANQAEIERIGDQINTMADKSASKEIDLLEILRRTGGTGKSAGLTSGDVLAFGAGLKERGVQTEIAASGIEDYFNFLKLGSEYSTGAEKGLKQLGYTSDALRKAFVANPSKTALEFLDKINAITNPMKRAEVLTGVFGKTRQDDVERLASSAPKIREYLDMINDPKNYKGSVITQFAEQLQNDVSKIDQASQQLDVLLKRLGDPMKQILGYGAGKMNSALDYIDDRKGNTSAAASNVFDDLPGLDYLKSGPSMNQFLERFNNAAPSAMRRTFGTSAFPGMIGKGNGARLGFGSAGTGAAPIFDKSNFGIGGGNGLSWANQGLKETVVNNVTNNTNTGNDQRTQSVTIQQTVNGVAGVASAAAEGTQRGLASMGASVVKGNLTSTGATTSP